MAISLDDFVGLLPDGHVARTELQRLKDFTAQSRFPEGEFISALFRKHYVALAPEFGVDPAVALPRPLVWSDLSPIHKRLMVAVSAITLNEIMGNPNINEPPPLP